MKVTKDVKELILEVTLVKMRFQIKFLRSSRPEVFYKKGVLRNFAKVTGKNLCQSLFIKKRLWHSCFPVNFAKFLRTPFLQNTSWRLPLQQDYHWNISYKSDEFLTKSVRTMLSCPCVGFPFEYCLRHFFFFEKGIGECRSLVQEQFHCWLWMFCSGKI